MKDILTKQSGMVIQGLLFDKSVFTTVPIAQAWAKEHGFDEQRVHDDGFGIILEQNPVESFKEDGFGKDEAFRRLSLTDGVSAFMGFMKSGSKARMDETKTKVRTMGYFTKVDETQRLVTGPALVPNVVDSQGDFELKEEIEKAAHFFMAAHRGIDEMHKVFEGIGVPVESHLLRDSEFMGEKLFPKGTWMLTVKVTNDDTWTKVKNGELRGFSIVFRGTREAISA